MIRNLTRLKLPRICWRKIKNKILSRRFDLSLVFVGDRKMSSLNYKYTSRNKPTNVLAFPLDKYSGEIFIDLPLAYREADEFGKTRRAHLFFLYIHAILHLKGFKHDNIRQLKIMNRAEHKWLKTFFPYQKGESSPE